MAAVVTMSLSGPSEGNCYIPPVRPVPPTPRLESIPDELRALAQWVVWKYILNGKKDRWTKVPYQTNGVLADTCDATSWATFEAVAKAYSSKRFDGIGLVTSADDPYVFIDLDHVVNKTTGEVSGWAAAIITTAQREGAYIEASPSGEGFHIIGRGTQLSKGHNRNQVEMYSSGRFFTMTGNAQ
jgi:putative DNA primase/helicase